MSNYIVTELGIKAFVEGSRVDFILQTPGLAQENFPRVTAKTAEPEAELTLDGKAFVVVSADTANIIVNYGTRTGINLGRCTKSKGKPSYYRGLEASNSTAPKTEAELTAVLSAWDTPALLEDQGPESAPDFGDFDNFDDDIPF
jgi:hypothetical protein